MCACAIRVEHLSKRYRIGVRRDRPTTLGEALSNAVREPFLRLGRIGTRPPEGGETPRDAIWALDDVSFEVAAGESVGVVGRNGAGKSTLLKVLSRITEPTRGRAEIRGRVGSLLEVGTGFHAELTGRENVYLNGAVLGLRREEIRKKFDEIVAFSEVETFLETPLKHYSTGMYLRLAFAVAAHLEAEILLVDEVLAVGDEAFQKKCLGKMGEVARQGRTVLYVSHNLHSLRNLCPRGLLIEQGKIAADGAIGDVIDRYRSRDAVSGGAVEWPREGEAAPGDGRLALRAVRLRSGGSVTDQVEITEDFDVEVVYEAREEEEHLFVSIHLLDSLGGCILASANSDSMARAPDPWYHRRYAPGVYRTSCSFPGKLLNDGRYAVSVYIARRIDSRAAPVQASEVLRFQVRDNGFMRQEYSGPWLGVLRMQLPWRTEPVPAAGAMGR